MSERTRRLGWRVGLGVAVVGVVSVGAFGIAAAAGGQQPTEPAPTQPAPTEEHDGPPWAGGHGDGKGDWKGGWGAGGLFKTLDQLNVEDLSRAEVVLATEGGGSTTMLVQKGTVTAVDGKSVAVRSADGFARTYAVTAETTVNGDAKIDSVAKDEQVVVVAPKGGQTPAASTILDLTDFGWK
ncbi:hypothetical protein BLA60_22545 [Actinophytocola xinjiangensis]|uniref:DUF5666 domain-containing protein n=1 Tax=Actinophytocola xinjiangensis TaxID=485602 RepID=A0A7Z1AX75_9PSEU|nr:hypothetical protein [Actinophytocola xinjiangensis]OLF08789.1 hypothetical protein BLA60_22545 [Actinophytocola xinjiangensis]